MISIVIPTYNEEGYIEKTVRQFQALDRKDFEVIVSDSRSTDKTVEIAKKYADRVVVLGEGRKRGISQGRNDGARAAKGEYIVFIDADVMVPDPPGFFARALRIFASDPKLVDVSARIRVLPELSLTSDKIIFGITNAYFAFCTNFLHIPMAAGEFQMVKAAAFRESKGFNEALAASEDMDLFRRLSKIGHVHTAWDLTVFHTGRRFHKVGWANTVYHWIKNTLSLWFFKKSADKEWEAIR